MFVVPTVGVGARACGLGEAAVSRAAVAVAPDYELFRGKPWESEYPKALVKYYESFSGACGRRCWGVCDTCVCGGPSVVDGRGGRSLDGACVASGSIGDDEVVSRGRTCDDGSLGGATYRGCNSTVGKGVVGSDDRIVVDGAALPGTGVDGSDAFVGGVVPEWRRNPPRGPNFARNQASRERKKTKRFFEQQRGFVGADPDAELAAKVRRMRLERQEIQEQRKLDKLKSPVQMIEDAMRQVALAEKYAKLANDSKVAEWAAKLSSASAESIALSAGAGSTDVGSGKASTVGTSYTKAVVDKFSVKKCPMSISEKTAVDAKVVRVDQIESLRRKIKRTLIARDFMFQDFPYPITMDQKRQIREAEDFCDSENIPIIEF